MRFKLLSSFALLSQVNQHHDQMSRWYSVRLHKILLYLLSHQNRTRAFPFSHAQYQNAVLDKNIVKACKIFQLHPWLQLLLEWQLTATQSYVWCGLLNFLWDHDNLQVAPSKYTSPRSSRHKQWIMRLQEASESMHSCHCFSISRVRKAIVWQRDQRMQEMQQCLKSLLRYVEPSSQSCVIAEACCHSESVVIAVCILSIDMFGLALQYNAWEDRHHKVTNDLMICGIFKLCGDLQDVCAARWSWMHIKNKKELTLISATCMATWAC